MSMSDYQLVPIAQKTYLTLAINLQRVASGERRGVQGKELTVLAIEG